MRRFFVALLCAGLPLAGCSHDVPQAELDAWPEEFNEDELVVDFMDDVGPAEIAAIEGAVGADFALNSAYSAAEVVTLAHVPRERMVTLARRLLATGRVENVEPNFVYTASEFKPNDPDYSKQWHMRAIGMPEAWEHAQGDGAVVAVIDTGVAYEDYKGFKRAPDLAETGFVPGYNFVSDSEHANDDHGHGTHVAGTIAQSTNNGVGVTGIAYKAKIMPLKVLNQFGAGTTADIADAIRYAADHGAQVINMSLGGGGRSRVMESAVKYARDKGVVVVCAAGNGGRRKVEFPAAYPGSLAVSALGPKDKLAPYSSYGPEVALAAPGGDKSLGNEWGVLQNTIARGDPSKFSYEYYQGTSMAAPHVAGVAALVMGAGVTEPAAVEKLMFESADTLGPGGRTDQFGYGRVNAAKAVMKAQGVGGGAMPFVVTALSSMLFVAGMRRRRFAVPRGVGYIAGLVMGGCGLFFLDEWLGGFPGAGLVAHGFPQWGLALFGAGAHASPIFYSALAPILAAAFWGRDRSRGLVCGFAVGMAAHLLYTMLAGDVDVRVVPNALWGTLDLAWLFANAALSLVVAKAVALRRPA